MAEDRFSESGDALLRTALRTSTRKTLQRLFVSWRRVDNPGGYRRKVLHNLVIDGIRARTRRPRELELIDSLDSDDPRCGDSAAAAEIRPASLAAFSS